MAQWHSCLPDTPAGWRLAFLVVTAADDVIGAASWGRSPSRNDDDWTTLALTRYALGPKAPRNAGSWGIAAMRRAIRRELPGVSLLVTFSEPPFHTGTIYKADNWTPVRTSRRRGSWVTRWERRP